MSKDLSISILIDFYGQLLTEKQSLSLELYYNQDLSLSEIADDMNITRQAVRDSIKRGEKLLLDFEEKLGLAKRFTDVSSDFDKIQKILKILMDKQMSDEIKSELIKIDNISNNIQKNL